MQYNLRCVFLLSRTYGLLEMSTVFGTPPAETLLSSSIFFCITGDEVTGLHTSTMLSHWLTLLQYSLIGPH